MRNAFAPILDDETKVPVLPVRGDRDRWVAVPQRIRDQVREHAIERRRIHRRGPGGTAIVTAFGWVSRADGPAPRSWAGDEGSRARYGSPPGRGGRGQATVRPGSASGSLVLGRVPQHLALWFNQLVISLAQRDGDAVDARQRIPQLVRGQRDELALEHVVRIHLLTSERVFEQGCSDNADARERIPIGFGG